MEDKKKRIKLKNRNTSFRTHKVKNGDSYISIANSYTDDNGHIRKRKEGELPLNYEDLAYYAGYVPGQEPPLKRGDRVLLEDPYILNIAVKSAEAPKDLSGYSYVAPPDITKEDTETIYANRNAWPEKPVSGQQLIRQYAAGIENGTITSKQVPPYLRTPVIQSLMTNSNLHNQLASRTSHFINSVFAPEAELAWYLGTKGAAAVNDKLSGRNEYTAKQLVNPFTWTPMTGTQYASAHPNTELALQAVTAGLPAISSAVVETTPAIQAVANNAVTYMKNAANDFSYGAVAGAKPQVNTVMKFAMPHNPYRWQGYGPTKMNGQFLKLVDKPINQPSPAPLFGIPSTTIPFSPYFIPMEFPIVPGRTLPPEPQKNSIFEQYSLSNWQLPYSGTNIVPVSGPASKVYSGYAPIGNSEAEQPIGYFTNITKGTAPRISIYSDVKIDPWTNYQNWNGYLGNSGLGYRYNEGIGTPLPSNIKFKNGGTLLHKYQEGKELPPFKPDYREYTLSNVYSGYYNRSKGNLSEEDFNRWEKERADTMNNGDPYRDSSYQGYLDYINDKRYFNSPEYLENEFGYNFYNGNVGSKFHKRLNSREYLEALYQKYPNRFTEMTGILPEDIEYYKRGGHLRRVNKYQQYAN